MGAGVRLEHGGVDLHTRRVGALLQSGDGVGVFGGLTVHGFRIGVSGKLQGVGAVVGGPDGGGQRFDERLGVIVVVVDGFALRVGEVGISLLLFLLLFLVSFLFLLRLLLLLGGNVGAVVGHVDGAHGAAADEHDEEEQADEGRRPVFRDDFFELVHVGCPFLYHGQP